MSRIELGEGYREGGDSQRGGMGVETEGEEQQKKTRGEEGQQECSFLNCVLHKLLPVRGEENLNRTECINRHVTVAQTKIC